MDNKIYSIVLILSLLLLVAACGEKNDIKVPNVEPEVKESKTSTPTQTVTPQSTQATGFAQLFDYSKTNEYQYRINTDVAGSKNTMDTDYKVMDEPLSGKPAWRISTTTTTDVGAIKTSMWIDKVTHKCLKWESYIENAGQKTVQQGACPISGMNSENYGDQEITSMGDEEITVPAGKFNAKRYESQGITYWTTPSIGVPVKIIYNDGTVKMVLMKYS